MLAAAPASAFKVRRGRAGIVRALHAQLAAYHAGFGEHSRNVASLAYRTALALGLSRREAKVIEAAGLVHDIGKRDVDLAVLNGTTPEPTAEGKAQLDLHPEKGHARFVAAFPEGKLADQIGQGILSHHERINGKGYPHKLKGDAIPLVARILAVVDAYDAMTLPRTYLPPKSHDEALLALRHSVSKGLLDADVVEAFISTFERSLTSEAVQK